METGVLWHALFKSAFFVSCFVLTSGASPSPTYYGALAYSPTTRAEGLATDYLSREHAERIAVANCSKQAKDCIAVAWFWNGCGALAVGANGGFGSGWGINRKAAETYALDQCAKYSKECTIRRWACTSR